jgi:deoxyribodipyrimidine photolyase-related protein
MSRPKKALSRSHAARRRRVTVWVPGDQLNPRISSLAGVDPEDCTVLMIESVRRARLLAFHKQKIAFVWSAMRHFAAELRSLGYQVDYFEECENYRTAVARHLRKRQPEKVRIMETAEYGGSDRLADILRRRDVRVEVTANNSFLSDRTEFARAAHGRKSVLMETFYRRMRRQTGLLMSGGKPEGGAWNYDRLNRERPPSGHSFPAIRRFPPDTITRRVVESVQRRFADHFGDVSEFWLPVKRDDAESFAEDFLDRRLDLFGPYEDAIVVGERALYHSLLSPLINVGMLEPLDLCRRAEQRYRSGAARLSSVEGFIRQLIGWREFIYQVYRWRMPAYAASNVLEADLPLPDFYWTGETDMRCIADAVTLLRRFGMNHHIQRLMITGNFALLAGVDPQAVNDWYRLAYVDAYDWVVTPNVLGMALFADGGVLATKPYAASANYIGKMGDCCTGCVYDRKATTGDRACPFNALYWDFLDRNRKALQNNPRMKLVLNALARRDRDWKASVRGRAEEIKRKLRRGERV